MSRVFTAFPALRASVGESKDQQPFRKFDLMTVSAQGSFPVTCVAGPSSRPFSTSPAVLAERKRFLPSRSAVKRKRNFYAQLAASERRQDDDTIYPDYVLGHVATTAPSSPFHGQSTPPSRTPWDNCRLAKTLMHPKQIWSLAPPAYDKGEKPEYLIPGLSKQDQDMLFGALPHVSTALRYDPEVPDQVREETVVKVMDQQEKQTEMLHRAMDMRNADRATINTFNLRRIQDEFGEGVDTGGAAVQGELR